MISVGRQYKDKALPIFAMALFLLPATAPSARAATGDVISVFTPPDTAPHGLTRDGSNLWLVDNKFAKIYEVTTTGAVLSQFDMPGSSGTGLAWDGSNLWLVEPGAELIYELTTAGAVLSSFSTPETLPAYSQGLTWDGSHLWNSYDAVAADGVYELETNGTVVSYFDAPCQRGLTRAVSRLWCVDGATDTVHELTATGAVAFTFSTPCNNPTGLTFDGTDFWLACNGTGPFPDEVYQLEGPSGPTPLIVKRTFQSDGTPVPDSSTLPSGLPVKFMIYLDNPGSAVTDVTLQDVLDPLFAYQTNSLKFDNSLLSTVVCPDGICDEAAIFAQVDDSGVGLGHGNAVNPPNDADAGSYNAGTTTIYLGDGNNTNNARLDLLAGRIWSVIFTVRIQ